MIEVDLSARGLEFRVVADELPQEVRQKLVERLAEIAYYEAFYGAPWKSGKLARSIVKEVEDGSASIRVLSPYGLFVVAGTAPHLIRPAWASCLVFKAKSGERVFTRLVRHPGTKPNPFLERAAEKTAEQVPGVFAEVWEEFVG